MILRECNFRDLYKQCVILKGIKAFRAAKDMMEEHSYIIPPNMDAVLCYCYIDSQAGMSFDFLCFIDFKTFELDFASYEKLFADNIRLFYRYGSVQDHEVKIYSKDVAFFEKSIMMIDEWYHSDKRVLPTRNVKQIDHLRYIKNPDDVRSLLVKDGLHTEEVWVRLTGIEGGNLIGILLNEPNYDFGVHINNLVRVKLIERNNKFYTLCLNISN